MFVPAPEEFTDEQATVMTDKWAHIVIFFAMFIELEFGHQGCEKVPDVAHSAFKS